MQQVDDRFVQLSFLEEPSDFDKLQIQVKAIKAELSNLRRGLFARHDSLAQMYAKLAVDHDNLKAQVDVLEMT